MCACTVVVRDGRTVGGAVRRLNGIGVAVFEHMRTVLSYGPFCRMDGRDQLPAQGGVRVVSLARTLCVRMDAGTLPQCDCTVGCVRFSFMRRTLRLVLAYGTRKCVRSPLRYGCTLRLMVLTCTVRSPWQVRFSPAPCAYEHAAPMQGPLLVFTSPGPCGSRESAPLTRGPRHTPGPRAGFC